MRGRAILTLRNTKKVLFFNTYTSTGWVALDIFNNVIYYMNDNFILIIFC